LTETLKLQVGYGMWKTSKWSSFAIWHHEALHAALSTIWSAGNSTPFPLGPPL